METKRRAVAGDTEHSVTWRTGTFPDYPPYYVLPETYDERFVVVYPEQQEVQSEGNNIRLLGRTTEDIGGPFVNRKIIVEYDSARNYISSSPTALGYNDNYAEGVLVPGQDIVSMLARKAPTSAQMAASCPPLVSDIDLDKYGATAISRVAPTNPLADAASTIGELRTIGGIPSIPGSSGNIGSEYLNYVFGIAPIVSEVQAYYASWQKAEKLLAQLERDSGKLVRRSYKFPLETTSTQIVESAVPGFTTGQTATSHNLQWGQRTVRTITNTQKWFSGAFTYHLPKAGTWRRTLAELDYLYGVKPGVDTLWELLPWSWLVDWQSNAGDVVKNLNAFSADGLIMPYGYVMVQQTISKHYSQFVNVRNGGVWSSPKEINAVMYFTSQQRRPATPFGFGFDWGGLSARQYAILAALGISRA